MPFSRLNSVSSLKALGALLLIAVVLMAFSYKILHRYWHANVVTFEQPQTLDVKRGTSVNHALGQLVNANIIHHPLIARLCLTLFQRDFTLKAGEYRFDRGVTSRALIFDRFSSGVSRQYPVTLVEGLTARAFLQQLLASGYLHIEPGVEANRADDINQLLLNSVSAEARRIMGGAPHPEGWFFPDTYYVTKGDSYLTVLKRAHQKMLQTLKREWNQRAADLPYENIYQALIMASLIEKETGAIEERPEIAGVFVRRLNLRMRLQTDPTVIYGMGDSYQGNLRRSDLKTDTPYNTYTRHGLPPTPIALPGLGAIHAALNPAPGTSLYFVAKGDGRHHFSDTLDEHLRAVQRYQIHHRRADYRSSPDRAVKATHIN